MHYTTLHSYPHVQGYHTVRCISQQASLCTISKNLPDPNLHSPALVMGVAIHRTNKDNASLRGTTLGLAARARACGPGWTSSKMPSC